MIIHGAFQTPIAEYDFEDSGAMDKGLSEYILDIEKAEKSEGNPQFSMTGVAGYQTKDDLLLRGNPFVDEFISRISKEIATYWSAITNGGTLPDNTRLVSWGNIYRRGTLSVAHTHPEANMAVTYYPKIPKGMGDIDPDAKSEVAPQGAFLINDPRPAARYDSSFAVRSSVVFLPKQGSGMIFTGWVEHFATPIYLDDTRICISTNVLVPK